MSSTEVLSREFVGCRRLLMRLVSRVVPHKDVEDVVQDTYIRACQTDYEVYQPRSFLVTIARNLALDHVKRADNRLCDSIDDETADLLSTTLISNDVTLAECVSRERFAHFCGAVKELPEQCRKVFVLKKVYGYSQKEIAKRLNISESAVEKHVATGLKRSRDYMKAIDCEENVVVSNKISTLGGGK